MTQQPQNSASTLTNEQLTAQVNALKAANSYRSVTILLLGITNVLLGLSIIDIKQSSNQRRAPEVNSPERAHAERTEFGSQSIFDRIFGNSPKGGGKSVIMDSVGR